MSEIFNQFDFNFVRLKLKIEKNGLKIEKKTLASFSESFVKFEDIGKIRIIEKSRKLIWLFLFAFFLVLGIIVYSRRLRRFKIGDDAEIIWFTLSIIFFIIYIFN